MHAAGLGHVECLNALLAFGAHTNIFDFTGMSALMKAAENGHLDCVQALIHNGADVNTVSMVCSLYAL